MLAAPEGTPSAVRKCCKLSSWVLLMDCTAESAEAEWYHFSPSCFAGVLSKNCFSVWHRTVLLRFNQLNVRVTNYYFFMKILFYLYFDELYYIHILNRLKCFNESFLPTIMAEIQSLMILYSFKLLFGTLVRVSSRIWLFLRKNDWNTLLKIGRSKHLYIELGSRSKVRNKSLSFAKSKLLPMFFFQ